ncbi:MAG TPA: 30S ribosomal protein S9 [Candidatus Babeliales bacterium]|nr:30S ribosomal protein S9 [Candidatus Babeliales bacterium]
MEKAKKATTTPKTASPAAAGKTPRAHGVGRRKSSVARVWLRRGNGTMTINGREYKKYFDTEMTRLDAATTMKVVPAAVNYDIEVNVHGGGLTAQAGAVKLGVARAFVSLDEELRKVLRHHNLLTVDARKKERKKYGQKAARRKFQFVKR